MSTLIKLACDNVGSPLAGLIMQYPIESTIALGISVAVMYGYCAYHMYTLVTRRVS